MNKFQNKVEDIYARLDVVYGVLKLTVDRASGAIPADIENGMHGAILLVQSVQKDVDHLLDGLCNLARQASTDTPPNNSELSQSPETPRLHMQNEPGDAYDRLTAKLSQCCAILNVMRGDAGTPTNPADPFTETLWAVEDLLEAAHGDARRVWEGYAAARNAKTLPQVAPEATVPAETTRLHMREIDSGLSDLQALVKSFVAMHVPKGSAEIADPA